MTALAALMLFVLAGQSASPVVPQRPSLTVHGSAYGRILFDGHGNALYTFTRDRAGRSNCGGAFGTVSRGDGRLQTTYAGQPLHPYVGDRSPRQVLCQNVREFGGLWLVVRPNGTVVR